MMRTRGGVRIAVCPGYSTTGEPIAVLTICGVRFPLTADESHELRDILQAAELDAARGNVIT
jgi:hypothetical protein